MSPIFHRFYIAVLTTIVVVITLFLAVQGYSYYSMPLEERFYHPQHDWFKPSGFMGHGLGIVGTALILFGVFMYIARKRYNFLARFGRLKYWLEFHIFLCTLGPIMVLFHTAFKFGGIVSIAFWSMVIVVASGVIGRFIYIQIPRTIEGRALSLQEVQSLKTDLGTVLAQEYKLSERAQEAVLATTRKNFLQEEGGFFTRLVSKWLADRRSIANIRTVLKSEGVPNLDIRKITGMVRSELSLNNRIERLQTMQNLFRYWHVAHLPFALIMLIIMVLHVGVALAFGYKWIF